MYIRFTDKVCRYVMIIISRGYIKKSLAQQCFWGTKHGSRMESLKCFWINLKSPPYVNFLCRYWGFHSGVVKNSILLQLSAMSLCRWFLLFWRNYSPSFSTVRGSWTLNPWRWTIYPVINFIYLNFYSLFLNLRLFFDDDDKVNNIWCQIWGAWRQKGFPETQDMGTAKPLLYCTTVPTPLLGTTI